MSAEPVLLLCDHAGLAHELPAGWSAARSLAHARSLRESLALLASMPPGPIVLLPIGASGRAETEALLAAGAGQPRRPLLVLLAQSAPPEWTPAAPAPALQFGWSGAPAAELALRLERLAREAELLRELEELRHRALHDDLTELLRPLAFEERLRAAFSAAQRHRFPITLVLLDLDAFGAVNKRFDHVVGDQVIRGCGSVIRSSLRAEDVAGRLGGDEFGLCLPYTDAEAARLVCGRIQRGLAQLQLPTDAHPPGPPISACGGFETFDGLDLPSLAVLRAHAERALRTAKQRGPGTLLGYRELGA